SRRVRRDRADRVRAGRHAGRRSDRAPGRTVFPMAALPSIPVRRRRALAIVALVSALVAASHTVAARTQPSSGARRVVSIIPATTEMLFAMGAGDRVVAVGSYDRVPPEVDVLDP